MKQPFLLLIGLFASLTTFAHTHDDDEFGCLIRDEKGTYREHNVDFQKMTLDITFDTKGQKVFGNVLYDFIPLQQNVDTLYIDGPGIEIEFALLDKKEVNYKNTEEGIVFYFEETLHWDEEHQLQIKYEAHPKKGIYFIGWDDETNRLRKQIWTQGQGIDNRHWIPGYDGVNDKMITETNITFETGFEVISNGNFIGKKENEDNTTTWQYAMQDPHVMYLIMIAIGEYDYKDLTSSSGVVSRQYFYADKPETFAPTYQYSVEMMDWMEKELNIKYPWGKIYRNVPVQDFLYGAMENTTSTIFTDYYVQDERAALERNYIGTNAHELTHQWFGDLITEHSGTHHWLHESFATHYAKHFKRSVQTEDEYQWHRRNEMKSAFSASLKNDYPVAHTSAGSARHYPKGSIVIDMMRYTVGDAQFRRVITHFLRKHSYDMVDTHLFYLQYMETLGVNLDWFFEQWLYKGGEPNYEVTYDAQADQTVFTVRQTHELNDLVGYFKMPIVFQVHYKDGTFDEVKEWIEGESTDVIVSNDNQKEIAFTLFDPNSMVLKTVDFEKQYDELIAQATDASNMIDRHDAILALEDIDIEEKRKDLIAIYENETFYANKAAIIKQLAKDLDNKKSQKLISKAIEDDEMQVRRAVIDYTKKIPAKLQNDYAKLLNDESYVTIETALKKLCRDFPESKADYLAETENMIGHTHNIRITWLEIMCEDNKNDYINELVDYTSKSFEFRTRISAMNSLDNLNYFDKKYVGNLLDAVANFNGRLARYAKNHLKTYNENSEITSSIETEADKRSWTPNEQERVDTFLESLEEEGNTK